MIAGVPEGVGFDEVDELVYAHWGERAQRIASVHLSSWKRTGAYRLKVKTKSGRQRSLIFKNAYYGHDEIPALKDLPLQPGPPEYHVYSQADSSKLADYTPGVYSCREVVPDKQYKYVLEDLSAEYKKPNTPNALLKVVDALPQVHRSLSDTFLNDNSSEILRFDHDFSDALRAYAERNLSEYMQSCQDGLMREFWELWPRIAELHAQDDHFQWLPLQPIHGDLNNTNVWVQCEEQNQIRLVDWEWTGWGFPHSDLVSLLKFASQKTVNQALRLFARSAKKLSLDEHAHVYHWCRLERGLLDAAFLSAQATNASTDATMQMNRHIHSAIKRVLSAYQASI